MIDIPEDIEKIARDIAQSHGHKIVGRWDEETQTVASRAGYGHWGHSPSKYADQHWREYTSAAEFMLEEIAKAASAERERCAAYIRSTYRDAEGEALRARFVVPDAKDGYLEAWHQANDVADAIMNPYSAE